MSETLDDLINEVGKLKNSIENNPTEEPTEPTEPTEPVVQIPEKKFWHISDALSRNDELLEAILKALHALKAPIAPSIPEAPGSTPSPPIVPSPAPMFPTEVPEKLNSLIQEQAETKTLLEGFPFKTNQDIIVTTGVAQQCIHQFKTYFIIVRADTGNTTDIGIGPKGVTTNTSYNLSPGESVGLTVDVLKNGLYIVGASGDSVSWIALI